MEPAVKVFFFRRTLALSDRPGGLHGRCRGGQSCQLIDCQGVIMW